MLSLRTLGMHIYCLHLFFFKQLSGLGQQFSNVFSDVPFGQYFVYQVPLHFNHAHNAV